MLLLYFLITSKSKLRFIILNLLLPLYVTTQIVVYNQLCHTSALYLYLETGCSWPRFGTEIQ